MQELPEQLVFGLDIGTRSLVGTVGARSGEHKFQVFALDSLEHETRAMMDGQIHDIPKVSESIKKMKVRLEAKLNRELSEVCIAAAGRVLKTVNVRSSHEFSEETRITDEIIHSLEMLGVEQAYEVIRTMGDDDNDYYCVGYSVMRYFINGQQMSNLSEHKGTKIEAEMIATFLPQDVVDDLYSAVENAGLNVANLTLEPIAAIDVAIPEKFRLLNIALVDVGAGTSDICVTNDGCVMAYGMIPHAGDEITEVIAKHCLVDFNTADQIKRDASILETVEFKDVMDLTQNIASKEVLEAIRPTVDSIAEEIAEKIKELNGGKSVSAVFVVGGGGKIKGFTETIAQSLGLPKERVALRGKEVLGEVEFLEKGVEKDPLLVTPIGICYSFYEAKNHFVYVTINGNRIKLYDNSKLTVLDAVVKAGIGNEDLFPKRGKELNFTLDGERRIQRGEPGEGAVIQLNGLDANISRPISKNDVIKIRFSTAGAPAELMIENLKEMKGSFHVTYNDRDVICPNLAEVNGELVSGFYDIKENDKVVIRKYYTLSQLMELIDLPYHEGILVNNMPADENTKVYENFTVMDRDFKASISYQILEDLVEDKRWEEELYDEVVVEEEEEEETRESKTLVYVNDTPVYLSGKTSYVVVDILDFYSFDMTTYRGSLVIEINGKEADFTSSIRQGDRIRLAWI